MAPQMLPLRSPGKPPPGSDYAVVTDAALDAGAVDPAVLAWLLRAMAYTCREQVREIGDRAAREERLADALRAVRDALEVGSVAEALALCDDALPEEES